MNPFNIRAAAIVGLMTCDPEECAAQTRRSDARQGSEGSRRGRPGGAAGEEQGARSSLGRDAARSGPAIPGAGPWPDRRPGRPVHGQTGDESPHQQRRIRPPGRHRGPDEDRNRRRRRGPVRDRGRRLRRRPESRPRGLGRDGGSPRRRDHFSPCRRAAMQRLAPWRSACWANDVCPGRPRLCSATPPTRTRTSPVRRSAPWWMLRTRSMWRQLADLLAKTKSRSPRDSGVTALRAALAAAKDKDAAGGGRHRSHEDRRRRARRLPC